MNTFRFDYDASGGLLNPSGRDLFLAALQARPDAAVLFVAHGWLNDRLASQQLFNFFSQGLAPTLVCGVSWPSHPWKSNAAGLVKGGAEMATYYYMKERAGAVGAAFGADLRRLRQLLPDLRIHLAGHSFGARLVTAAAQASAPAGLAPFIASMTLIQAAFSHNAFAPGGGFRDVLSRRLVRGPILVTHSIHDQAVGMAYPIASRLKKQNASSLGDAGDPYGGLGRNGALGLTTTECIHLNLGDIQSLRRFLSYPVINLNADRVFHSHTGIEKTELLETLKALWSPAGTAPPDPQS
jgi:pimeloyl-ACP methyl ester carboxylesterase